MPRPASLASSNSLKQMRDNVYNKAVLAVIDEWGKGLVIV